MLAAGSRVALHKSAGHRGGAVLAAGSRVALHKSAGPNVERGSCVAGLVCAARRFPRGFSGRGIMQGERAGSTFAAY